MIIEKGFMKVFVMRKNFGSKPFLYPMPVLVIGSYDENGVPNAMNAAWGAISDYTRISICVSSGHKTMKNIRERKAFTVSIADAKNVIAADYVGIVSGNKVPDKFENTGWHAVKSENVDAPIIEELPMTLECNMASYDEESEMLVGDIVNICADERVLSEDGKIDPTKLDPITYDPVNNTYLRLGQKVGEAFADGKNLK